MRRLLLERFRPDDDVGDVGLVLERHEDDALRRSRPLPHQHEAGDGDPHILPQIVAAQRRVAHGAERGEALAEEAHRMLLQRQAGGHIILHDMLGERHGGKRDRRLREQFVAHMRGKERQLFIVVFVVLRGFVFRSVPGARRANADHVEPPRRP